MTAHEHDDLHDRGLQFDLSTLTGLLRRRRVLGLFAGAGAAATLAACGDSTTTASPTSTTPTTPTTTPRTSASAEASYTEIPAETAGPYPGDGSNGPNVLTRSGIVRSDITTSFGSAGGVAQGVPLTINLMILDLDSGGAAYTGSAVYLWHCDREGRYSMYSDAVKDENYLRGVQEANATGLVTFRTIFPAAYPGRWPHVHFEVYPTLSSATGAENLITTSQLALPEAVCDTVYATDGYPASVRNLSQSSLTGDMVFRDGWTTQLATVTGSVADGYVATLTVAV